MSDYNSKGSLPSSDQDTSHPNGPGGANRYNSHNSEYPAHRAGYSNGSYYKGGGQGKYNGYTYDNVDNTAQDYHHNQNNMANYRGYQEHGHPGDNYRSDYYYNGNGQGTSNRYHSGRASYSYENGQNHSQAYHTENDYQYYGNSRRGGGTHYQGRGYHSGPSQVRNQYSDSKSYPSHHTYSQGLSNRPYESGNHLPIDNYHRTASQSSALNTPTGSIPPVSAPPKRRFDKNESPFFYLTDLDKSTDDTAKLDKIKQVLSENDSLDRKIEQERLKILKDELELSLLTSQCERDSLNVQLTQEKLDSLLMQG